MFLGKVRKSVPIEPAIRFLHVWRQLGSPVDQIVLGLVVLSCSVWTHLSGGLFSLFAFVYCRSIKSLSLIVFLIEDLSAVGRLVSQYYKRRVFLHSSPLDGKCCPTCPTAQTLRQDSYYNSFSFALQRHARKTLSDEDHRGGGGWANSLSECQKLSTLILCSESEASLKVEKSNS